ncbi:hypothetical protein Vadar_015014 [Vaccinium darrowii]|uniref:Uncharacterized protein n=1 Tax=Vaccinium darrowii TaxID=229202 RepID=A0ACB7YVZ2_9ERIC|nr:hypothetical protein Vadar_015014 [Vaccinium darrowii]
MPPPSIPPLAEAIHEGAAVEQPSAWHFPDSRTGPVVAPTKPVSLKRKRPPTIEIPNVLREIPFRDFAPRDDDAVSFSGSGVGVFSVKGKKKFMEDTHKICVSCSDAVKGFFGVYDGHGGRKAAEFVAENLHSNILKMLENRTGNEATEEAVRDGYLKTDQEFLKLSDGNTSNSGDRSSYGQRTIWGLGSGACCVTALIEKNEIVISNVGDCRAILCRGGVAEALTKDHRAGQVDERKRIESKGGYVEIHRGAWRVHGILSVSRSIGDAHLKDWVLAEPDTKTLNLARDMEYLILASDGLWEEVGNQEAVDIVVRSCLLEKKLGPITDNRNGNGDRFGVLSPSTSPVIQRVALVKPKKKIGQSRSKRKTVSRKERENGFACENESPPSKIQRISSQMNMKIRSPNQERSSYKERPASSGLMAACNELVNLAVTRGSLDDITVMIIDLNHFR